MPTLRSTFWIVLTILGLYFTLRGYHSRDGDQAYRLPLLLNRQDPALFANDPFVRAFDNFNPHKGYLVLLEVCSQPLGLSFALLGLFVATFVITVLAVERLARTVWPGQPVWVGWGTVGLFLLAKAGNIGTNHLFEAMLLDRLMGLGLGWVAISECLARPRRGAWTGGILLGAAGLIHPTMGLQLALTLSCAWLAWWIFERPSTSASTVAIALTVLGLGQIPNLAISLAQAPSLFEGIAPDDFRALTVQLQSPQHMLPSSWRGPQWAAWFSYVVLALISLGKPIQELFRKPARPIPVPGETPLRKLAILLLVNLLSLLTAYIVVGVFENLRVTVFQPFRMATLTRGLALLALSGRLVMLWNRAEMFDRVRVAILVSGVLSDRLMVAAAIMETLATLSRVQQRPYVIALSLVASVWYLSRHDTESGHWVLGPAWVLGLVCERAWFQRGVERFGSDSSSNRRVRWTVAFCIFAWLVPGAALIAPLVLDPNRPGSARILDQLAGRCRFWATPTDDMERLAVWSREHTPKSSRFVSPPGPKTFRLWSEREVAFNRAASPYAGRGLADWAKRYRDHLAYEGSIRDFVEAYLKNRHKLESRFDKATDSELSALAIRQGADHVVALSRRGADQSSDQSEWLEPLHTEGRYTLYRVRPAAFQQAELKRTEDRSEKR